MKFIKISLLSLLLLFLGLFGILFGTLVNNSSNNSSNVNLLKSEREEYTAPTPIDFSLNFDENYWEVDGKGNRIYVTADWSTPNDWYDDPYALIKLRDVETNKTIQGSKTWASLPDKYENNTLTKTEIEGDTTNWHYEAMIENNTDNGVRFYLEDNHEYIISVELNNYGWRQEEKFTTPSKSVINLTETTGNIMNVSDQSVVIDTTKKQESNQVADNVFLIEENLELNLITGTSSSDYDETSGVIDIAEGNTIEVTGLDADTLYDDWRIEGNYYNGFEIITIVPRFLTPFTTNEGINYDYHTVEITSTDNSIIVKLFITNQLEQSVDMKFYNGSSEDGDRTELTEVTMISTDNSSDTDPDAVWGWVTYEITGLDYDTTYDLYIQIGDNRDEQLGLIKTLDAYPWIAPLNITLLVIIVIEAIASVALFGMVFLHGRKNAL